MLKQISSRCKLAMESRPEPIVLARGPWRSDQVSVAWSKDEFQAETDASAAADRALTALRERGSPAHDGLAGRIIGFNATANQLAIAMQPTRWSLRLVDGADGSLSV